MIHRSAALALVLALGAITPEPAVGQSSSPPPRARKLATLGQNFPNPFRPETYIPFTIDDCEAPGRQRVVSLRVYNVLAQLVAVEPARYYLSATLTALLDRLRAGMPSGADYGPAELREVLGFSRKFLIPFLEFTDRAGHTVRDSAGRRRRGVS